MFELVNEPYGQLADANEWNDLMIAAIDTIRATDATRAIMVSPGFWAGVDGLRDLTLPEDTMLIVSLHYYRPSEFVLQGSWATYADEWVGTEWHPIQPFKDMVISHFEAAVDFSEANNVPIHIGEWGTYEAVPTADRQRYFNYHSRYFESLGWSWALWDFNLDFGIYDNATGFIQDELYALIDAPMPASTPYTASTIYQSNFTSGVDGWSVFGDATLVATAGELAVLINNGGDEAFDTYVYRTIPLYKGKVYRISYTIRSSANRGFIAERLGSKFPWHNIRNVDQSGYTRVNSFWMSYDDQPTAIIRFGIGDSEATFYVSDFEFEELTIVDDAFDVLYAFDFENRATGTYNYDWIPADFNNPSLIYDTPSDYGATIESVSYPENPTSTKTWRFNFKQNNGNPYGSNIYQWYPPIGNQTEVYMSYNVRFKPDFEPVINGKIPGMRLGPDWPGTGPPPDGSGAIFFINWRVLNEIPELDLYIYHADHSGDYGVSYPLKNPGLVTNYLPVWGEWFNITVRVVANDVGSYNGIIEIFINGVLAYQRTNYRLRVNSDVYIDQVVWQAMFGGGGSEYWPTRDEWIEIDDFTIFRYGAGMDVPRGNSQYWGTSDVLTLPNWR